MTERRSLCDARDRAPIERLVTADEVKTELASLLKWLEREHAPSPWHIALREVIERWGPR